MKKYFFLVLVLPLCLISFLNAEEQNDKQCKRRNSVTIEDALNNARRQCCEKRGAKKCLKNLRNKTLKAAKKKLPDVFVAELTKELKQMITSRCSDVSANNVCTNATTMTLNEAEEEIQLRCCNLTKNERRKSCLANARKQYRKSKDLLGTNFFQKMSKRIKELNQDKECGAGGEMPTGACQQIRDHVDGANNYLHKPVSESTHSVVNLFPPSERPSDCRYENTAGDLYSPGYWAGIHNGNRVHIRPTSGGSCRNFPSPLVLNCDIGGIRVCRIMPNPCVRYD